MTTRRPESEERQTFVSHALEQQYIRLEETADGIWSIHSYDVVLGKLDEWSFRLRA